MKTKPLIASACLLLAACTATAQPTKPFMQSQKETRNMNSKNIHPKMTQGQVLTRVLELMKTSTSVKDFTPERLNEVFKVPFSFDKYGEYQFHETITKNWFYVLEISKDGHFRLSFNPKNSLLKRPDMTEICEMDADEFVEKAVSAGFTAHPAYESGFVARQTGYVLTKDKLKINMIGKKEYIPSKERPNPKRCVERIII